jgi:hypothetical protein
MSFLLFLLNDNKSKKKTKKKQKTNMDNDGHIYW